MYHRTVILLLACLVTSILNAQDPVKELAAWQQQFPTEKIYLHTDRDRYQLHDTVWFKAYLSQDYLPDTLSTVLYVELISSDGRKWGQQVLPVIFGTSYGQFELPDSCKPGEYLIRAWTPLMLNGSSSRIYEKYFRIDKPIRAGEIHTLPTVNAGTNAVNEEPGISTLVAIQFFPEGGNLIGGVVNNVAFQIKNESGTSIDGTGILYEENGKELFSIGTVQQGRGIFEWTPERGKKYFVKLSGSSRKFSLPEIQQDGLAMTLIPHPQGWFFELRAGSENPLFRPAYMVGQMQQEIVFQTALSGNKKGWQGLLNTTHLHSGILRVTIFNTDHMPLAERLCFVDNGEYKTAVNLQMDSLSFVPHALNQWKLQLADTIRGSLSVSITDATQESAASAKDNIISTMLLSASVASKLSESAWYFQTTKDSSISGLDLLMMTDGWTRFNWETIGKELQNGNQFQDPGFITLEGTVLLKGTRKPFANKDLFVIMGAMGRGQNLFLTKTDDKGKFKLDSMLFSGNVRFYFMEPRGKKSQYIEVQMKQDTISIAAAPLPVSWLTSLALSDIPNSGYDVDAISKEEGTLLEGITVEAHRKSPEQIVDERYSSGLFSGFATRSFDLVSEEQLITEPTIFDYLIARVPGLSFTANGPDYVLYYRQGPSASSLGPIPMTVFLNEVETDPSVIAAIPPNDIALVKIFNTFVGAFGNGAGGAMAIYTKKGADMSKAAARGAIITYRGFSIRKEFQSPDYKALQGIFVKADRRKTLEWRPNIFVNHVNPSIPVRFYNNDGAKAFRIRVEGMTSEGKLISFDQLIRSEKH